MRRTTVAHLEPRIDPHRARVGDAVIEADAVDLLRRGLPTDATWARGRLCVHVPLEDLAIDGEAELVRRAVAADPRGCDAIRRVVDGAAVSAAERAALSADDRVLLLLVERCLGRAVGEDDLAALALPPDDPELARLRDILRSPVGARSSRVTDDPPSPRGSRATVWALIWTGDLEGLRRSLAEETAEAEALEASGGRFRRWDDLAGRTRALTGDDAAARALLDRLPLIDAVDGWLDVFGEEGERRVIAALERLLSQIERAFDGVPFPGPSHRSLFQAEAVDSYRWCDQSGDHVGRWQDLPDEHLVACQFSLPYLDAASLQYYLPAVLSFAVRSALPRWRPARAGYIYDSLRWQLDHWTRTDGDERLARLTREQVDAVIAFARFYDTPPAVVERWEARR